MIRYSLTHIFGEQGASPPVVVLPGEQRNLEIRASCAHEFHAYIALATEPTLLNIEEHAVALLDQLRADRIRRGNLLGLGIGGAVAQRCAALEPKLCRRLILVDPETRIEPTLRSRWVDRVERWLPLGLPLRPLSQNFDARPLLHRIRCPVLVLNSPYSSPFQRAQAQEIARRIPSAWLRTLSSSPISENLLANELIEHARSFLCVAVKQPQKNLKDGQALAEHSSAQDIEIRIPSAANVEG